MATVRIAHLSDLHFVPGKVDPLVWDQVRDFLNHTVRPHAVLITGDVTDSATQAEFALAHDKLEQLALHPQGDTERYRIVAGNHDRFIYRGNVVPFIGRWFPTRARDKAGRFDATFTGARQVTPKSSCDIELPRAVADGDAVKWQVRIVGMDSSAEERWFAQGYLSETAIANACGRAVADAQQKDLVIALVHHHLLPIPAVERAKRDGGKLQQLLDATGMLNAGTLLERLSHSQVDLVLHGHEHEPHHARFGSATALATDVAVIGAGSATGDATLNGWRLDRVHFNIIELDDDRSVWLQQVSGEQGSVQYKGDRQLVLEAEDIRASRFVRRNRSLDGQSRPTARPLPRSKLRKLVEFRSNRDIQHTETRTECHCGTGWSVMTSSASGILGQALVEFEWHRDAVSAPLVVAPVQSASRPDQHDFGIDLDPANQNRMAWRVTTRWTWTGAAVLTQRELDMLPPTARQGPRLQRQEFAAVHCDGEFQELVLSVRLPPYFAPQPRHVRAYFDKSGGGDKAEYSAELSAGLDVCGPGNFELRIPFPMPGYRYGLSWPVSDKDVQPAEAAAFEAAVRNRTADLAQWMDGQLAQGFCCGQRCCWALYLPTDSRLAGLTRIVGDSQAPQIIVLDDARGLARVAFWGDAVVVLNDGSSLRYEVLPHERIVGYFAVREQRALTQRALAVLRLSFQATPQSLEPWIVQCKSAANLLSLNLAAWVRGAQNSTA